MKLAVHFGTRPYKNCFPQAQPTLLWLPVPRGSHSLGLFCTIAQFSVQPCHVAFRFTGKSPVRDFTNDAIPEGDESGNQDMVCTHLNRRRSDRRGGLFCAAITSKATRERSLVLFAVRLPRAGSGARRARVRPSWTDKLLIPSFVTSSPVLPVPMGIRRGSMHRRTGGRTWLDHDRRMRSVQGHGKIGGVWSMVARISHAQLGYSVRLLALNAISMLFMYAAPRCCAGTAFPSRCPRCCSSLACFTPA